MTAIPHAEPAVDAGPVRARRVRPGWLIGGVVAIVAAALLSWLVVQGIQTQNQVVVVATNVPRGGLITQTTLTTVTVGSVAGVSTVPASQLQSLVGKYATVDLVQGALLPEGAVSELQIPKPGNSVVGLQLASGRVPSEQLKPGSNVRLVAIPEQDGAVPGPWTGTVVSIKPATDGISTLVDVEVSWDVAATVSQLAAVNRIAVIHDAS